MPPVLVHSLHLLHSLCKQGYFDLQMSKLGLVTSATQIVATWLLGINLACWNLESDQAECQGLWTYCFKVVVF